MLLKIILQSAVTYYRIELVGFVIIRLSRPMVLKCLINHTINAENTQLSLIFDLPFKDIFPLNHRKRLFCQFFYNFSDENFYDPISHWPASALAFVSYGIVLGNGINFVFSLRYRCRKRLFFVRFAAFGIALAGSNLRRLFGGGVFHRPRDSGNERIFNQCQCRISVAEPRTAKFWNSL